MRSNHDALGRMPKPWPAVAAAAWWTVVLFDGAAALAAPPVPVRTDVPSARPRPVVDHAVLPAGGAACRHCPGGACAIRGGHHGHLDGCRDGLCMPHCPVRPAEYGFYRTQWRRWPGQGVVPVSAEQEATPVSPPASLTPSADQESPMLPGGVDSSSAPPADGRDDDRAVPPAEPPRSRKPADPLPEEPSAAAPAPARDAAFGATEIQPVSVSAAAATGPQAGAAPMLDEAVAAPLVPAGPTSVEPAGLRYPAAVGRSLAGGVSPWRLQPEARQRPVASARGL